MEAEPLAAACELAFAVAREGLEAEPAIDPPASMRSFLYVAQLPPRAMSVAQRAIEDDLSFRARVAERATEASVGRTGYLWLNRPDGWEAEFGATSNAVAQPQAAAPLAQRTPPPPPQDQPARPVESPPPAPTAAAVRASIEDELSNLRGLVDRLADEGRMVTTSVHDLETELEERRTEVHTLRNHIESLDAERALAERERDSARSAAMAATEHGTEIESELTSLRASIEELETARDEARTRVVDYESQLAVKDHSLVEADTELGALRATLAGLTERAESAEQIEAELATLKADNEHLAAIVSEVQTERDAALGKLDVAETARIDLEAQLGDLSAQSREAQVEIEELAQAGEASLAGREQLFDDVAERLAEVEAERDRLASQLAAARSSLSGAMSAFRSASDAVGSELNSTELALDEATTTAAGLAAATAGASGSFSVLHEAAGGEVMTTAADSAFDTGFAGDTGFASDTGLAGDTDFASDTDLASDTDFANDTGLVGDTGLASDTPLPADTEVDGGAAYTVDADAFAVDEGGFATDEVALVDPSAWLPEADFDEAEPEVDGTEAEVDTGDEAPFANQATFDEPSDEPAAEVGDDTPAENIPLDDMLASYVRPDDLANTENGAVEAGVIDDIDLPTEGDDLISEVATITAEPGGRKGIDIPDEIADDSIAVARHVASTDDVVLLVDGDAVAEMGWPGLSPADRRNALVSYLGDLAADTGAAPDTVFDGGTADDESLPVSRAVRVRLTASGVDTAGTISDLVDGYPAEWPVAVVTDDPALIAEAHARGASVLNNGQLLDLFTSP